MNKKLHQNKKSSKNQKQLNIQLEKQHIEKIQKAIDDYENRPIISSLFPPFEVYIYDKQVL